MDSKGSIGGASQVVLTPSNSGMHNRFASNVTTPVRAQQQTPRATTGGGRGAHADPVTHKKLSQRRLAIYDRVYGQILFPPVIRLFIDSPEVQRLRDLKQIGNGHYVYPSATHTRFEHSLGVSHLAMTFLKQILTNHAEEPGLGVQLPPLVSADGSADMQRDIWCVGIAGLCHDLGHGPLSHMFEHYVNIVRATEGKAEWSHEMASVRMLRSIWSAKRTELATFGLGEDDLAFVELLIKGLKPGRPWPKNVGRSEDMRFMTDIIANKRSGLDVDKIDYLQRDSLSCFGSSALVSLDRVFQGACVMSDERGETQICYQSKLDLTVAEIFQARTRLHRIVYQHRVTCVIDRMSIDAFLLADKHFTILCDGREYRLSECVDVPGAYVQTGDWIINAIMRSHIPGLQGARSILDRIQNRRIYTTIGTTTGLRAEGYFSKLSLLRSVESAELRDRLEEWEKNHDQHDVLGMLQTNITTAAGDMKNKLNPVDAICFYNPRYGAAATPYLRERIKTTLRGVSLSQPAEPEQTFIVFCRMPLTSTDLNELSEAFNLVSSVRGASGVQDRSVSPRGTRDRSISSGPASALSQPQQTSPSVLAGVGLSVHKRGQPGESGTAGERGSGVQKHRRLEQQQDGGGRGDGGDLITPPPPPQVLLQASAKTSNSGPRPSPQPDHVNSHRRRSADSEDEGDDEDDNSSSADVHLTIPALSQLENNSQSNADEPDIHVEFSNLSAPGMAYDHREHQQQRQNQAGDARGNRGSNHNSSGIANEEENSHLEPGKRRKTVKIHEKTADDEDIL